MISLVFAAFVAVIFFAIRACNQYIKQEEAKIDVTKWILLIASYLFVAYADLRFAMVLAWLTAITWFCAKNLKFVKWGITAALLSLGYFKYTNFFAESFAKLFGQTDYVALKIMLPLGISFYAFSAISYLVDVQRGKLEARQLKDVALYLAFFPKITSGPIQRSRDFFGQIDLPRNVGWKSFSQGIQIFMFGVFKKLVLADRLSVFVNQVYDTPSAFSSLTVFLAVLAYSMQIYFDFSGYSDVAIGVARILDIRLPKNFNLPYLSHNVTELWKRWHISLSSWLQEYLYISLGGNRKGKVRTYVNLILTMVLGGIWHGPKWTYIVWGLLHGIALAVHKVWARATDSPKKKHSAVSNIISICTTFLFTSFCWVFFRAESVSKALAILSRILSFQPGLDQMYVWFFFSLTVLIIGSAMAIWKSRGIEVQKGRENQSVVQGFYPVLCLEKFWHLVLFFVFCGLILGLAYTGGSPFIYGEY